MIIHTCLLAAKHLKLPPWMGDLRGHVAQTITYRTQGYVRNSRPRVLAPSPALLPSCPPLRLLGCLVLRTVHPIPSHHVSTEYGYVVCPS